MKNFEYMTREEMEVVEGGGVASLCAGALAGAMIGSMLALPYAAYEGDITIVGKTAILGASTFAYIGAACPLP